MERRLLLLASVAAFMEVALFSAIAPLLPSYASQFDLSKAGAGVLTASYAAGALCGGLPAGFISARFGPRRTVFSGLLVLGTVSVIFSVAPNVVVLDLARLLQGFSGAMVWSGALAWLILATDSERRGEVIGSALGTATAGALIGPAVGGIAASVGVEPVFALLAGVCVALAILAMRLPDARPEQVQRVGEVLAAAVRRGVLAATLYVGAPSLMFGTIEVLVPLGMSHFGAGHAEIAAAFLAAALVKVFVSRFVGRFSDRVGRRGPLVVGLLVCSGGIAIIGLAPSLVVISLGLLVSALGSIFCTIPALATMSEAAESSGLNQGYAAGIFNSAWAIGEVLGGLIGGAVAGALGDAAAAAPVVVLMFAVAAVANRGLRK